MSLCGQVNFSPPLSLHTQPPAPSTPDSAFPSGKLQFFHQTVNVNAGMCGVAAGNGVSGSLGMMLLGVGIEPESPQLP